MEWEKKPKAAREGVISITLSVGKKRKHMVLTYLLVSGHCVLVRVRSLLLVLTKKLIQSFEVLKDMLNFCVFQQKVIDH